MKIQNRILLFAIEILTIFLELNAMWEPHGEGSSMPNYIPQTPRTRGGHREGAGRPRNPKLTMEYLNRKITVTVTISRQTGIPVAKDCILDGENNHGVPDKYYREKHDYYTFALYEMLNGHELKCVIYVKQDVGGITEVLGAKPPTKATSYRQLGVPRYLNPDKTTWFITYATLDFVVTQEIINGIAITVNIVPMHFNNNHPSPGQITSGAVDTFEGYIGGQHFLAFLSDGIPVGCMLPPLWWTEQVQANVLNIPRNKVATMRMYIKEKQQRGH